MRRSYPGDEQPPLLNINPLEKSRDCEIEDFLAFLYKQKELEIYYFLLTSTSIKKIADNRLEIISHIHKQGLHTSLTELLFAWTAKNWHVIITKSSDILSTKDELLSRFKDSEQWELIKNLEPSAQINDVLIL